MTHSVDRERHSHCAATSRFEELAPRLDAQATDLRTGVGGWLTVFGTDGCPERSASPLFAEEAREEDFPWIFHSKLLAMLLTVRVIFRSAERSVRTHPTGTTGVERRTPAQTLEQYAPALDTLNRVRAHFAAVLSELKSTDFGAVS